MQVDGLKVSLLLGALVAGSLVQAQQCPANPPVFAAEFNGMAPDTSKWEVMVGDGCSYGLCGWGNHELQSFQAANQPVAPWW